MRSDDSSKARLIAASAASSRPWMSRSCARPGCGDCPVARLPVPLFGFREVSAQTMELCLLIVGECDSRLTRRIGVELARALHFGQSGRPGTVQLKDLRSVDETLAAERRKVRLRLAP